MSSANKCWQWKWKHHYNKSETYCYMTPIKKSTEQIRISVVHLHSYNSILSSPRSFRTTDKASSSTTSGKSFSNIYWLQNLSKCFGHTYHFHPGDLNNVFQTWWAFSLTAATAQPWFPVLINMILSPFNCRSCSLRSSGQTSLIQSVSHVNERDDQECSWTTILSLQEIVEDLFKISESGDIVQVLWVYCLARRRIKTEHEKLEGKKKLETRTGQLQAFQQFNEKVIKGTNITVEIYSVHISLYKRDNIWHNLYVKIQHKFTETGYYINTLIVIWGDLLH